MIVGHIPREISRFCHFYLNYDGVMEGRLRNVKYITSPIPSGGLEILIILIVKKEGCDNAVFKWMKELLKEYYLEPDKIAVYSSEVVEVDDDVDFEPFEPKESEGQETVIENFSDSTNDTIVIDDSEVEERQGQEMNDGNIFTYTNRYFS